MTATTANTHLCQLQLEQYKAILEEAYIVSKATPDGKIFFVNDAFCRISGYRREELIGHSHRIIRHPDTPSETFESLWSTILAKKSWRGVLTNRHKDGSRFVLNTLIAPVLNQAGEIMEFIALREDISSLLNTQHTLEQEKAKVECILNNQVNLIASIRAEDGLLLQANRAFLAFFQVDSLDTFQQNGFVLADRFLAEKGYFKPSNHHWDWPRIPGEIKEHRLLMRNAQGEKRMFLMSMSLTNAEQGVYLLSFADVTLVEEARIAAEASEAAKAVFLASMSHEIRTPIHALKGFADLLADTQLDNQQRHHLDIIQSSSQQLLGVVDDILDYSKIEAGKMSLNLQPIRFLESLIKFAALYETLAHNKGVDFAMDLPPSVPEGLIVDELRLNQVLGNLLANAIKFTPTGGQVRLAVSLERIRAHQAWLRFSVMDTGLGIPQDQHERIFNRFAQAHVSVTQHFGGTGLGLSISRSLVLLMGGDGIRLESSPGQGATFSFSLPFALPEEDLSLHRALSNKRLGVFTGGKTQVAEFLRDYHLSWQEAETLCAQHCSPGRCIFDILIVEDMASFVGVQQGISAQCEYIFLQEPPNIIQQGNNVRFIHDFVMQPQRLYFALSQLLHRSEQQTVKEVTSQFNLKVLVAEDNLVNQLRIQEVLSGMNVEVHLVENGQEAVVAMAKNTFDMVLMDINMPVMNGVEAMLSIRQGQKSKGQDPTPIVALTANVMARDVTLYLDKGFDDHLSKPLQVERLKNIMARYASKTRAKKDKQPQPQKALNLQQVAMQLQIPTTSLLKLLQHLQNLINGEIPKLQQSIQTGDMEKLRTQVHNLYGSLTNLRMDELAQRIKNLGDLAKQNAATSLLQDQLQRFNQEQVKVFQQLLA